jgi:hypothetical protein
MTLGDANSAPDLDSAYTPSQFSIFDMVETKAAPIPPEAPNIAALKGEEKRDSVEKEMGANLKLAPFD